MSTPKTPAPFTLSRATPADLLEMVQLQYTCFPTFVREVFMGCKSEADLPRCMAAYETIMTNDKHTIWVKVTDNMTGRIIAASDWKVYPNGAPEGSDDRPAAWLEGEERVNCERVLSAMNAKRREANPVGYVHLHICFTSASYRRCGAGHMMMQWGCDVADALFLPAWVEASDEGNFLYKTFGFVDYEKLTGDLPGTNMRREVRVEGAAGGKARG